MSMNRFVGFGVFALSASAIVTLGACDSSSTIAPVGNGGSTTTVTGNGGSTVTGSGGATGTTTAKGGTTGTTTTPTGTGGTTTTTTPTGTGGSTGTPGTCTAATNLIAEALASTSTNWIGGDPASTADNPCGVQGAIYAYSDDGLDKAPGGADASVQSPAIDTVTVGATAETRLSPCAAGSTKCCISGNTTKWPLVAGAADYTASVWGGGIGISLGDPGANATTGAAGVKAAYAGTATGFNITVSGTLNGQVLRIGYTQSATDTSAPFKEVTALGAVALPFTGVTCPTWATATCVAPSAKPFDIQVQVVGGDAAGAFNVCIDSITPIL